MLLVKCFSVHPVMLSQVPGAGSSLGKVPIDGS